MGKPNFQEIVPWALGHNRAQKAQATDDLFRISPPLLGHNKNEDVKRTFNLTHERESDY